VTPPIQILNTFFTETVVRAHSANGSREPALQNDAKLRYSKENDVWEVVLTISSLATGEDVDKGGYELRVTVHGLFRWVAVGAKIDGIYQEGVAKAVFVTGASILYSAAREYVLGITARGPWGPSQFPATTFADFKPEVPIPISIEQSSTNP
jgi:preprotein translocase subunit SecB